MEVNELIGRLKTIFDAVLYDRDKTTLLEELIVELEAKVKPSYDSQYNHDDDGPIT